MMPAGRPSIYTEELAEEICARIAGGRSVMSVASDDDMPEERTIYRWRETNAEFSQKLSRAREERLEADRNEIRQLGRAVMVDTTLDPQRVSVAVAALDKAARLMMPKQRVAVGGDPEAPPQKHEHTHQLSPEALARLKLIAEGE